MNWSRNLWSAGCFCLAAAALVILSGCALLPPNSFLDQTRVGMFPSEYREGGIRRVLTPREGPVGLANATEPTPDDLVPFFDEYRIGVQDGLSINIEDFLRSGFPFTTQIEVSPTGYVRLPELGSIRVVGMTEKELEDELRTRLQEAGILPQPVVQVFIINKRSRYFSVIGGATRPGAYPLAQPDTRLLDVLGQVGDITPLSKRIYVVRRTSLTAELETETPLEPPSESREIIVPPDGDEFFESTTLMTQQGDNSNPPKAEVEDNPSDAAAFEEILAPRGQATQPAAGEAAPQPQQRRFAPLIFDPVTGTLQEAPRERSATEEPMELESLGTPETSTPPWSEGEEFDWDAVPEYELSQRVIEINVAALKAGDPRQNIVVRDRDMINIPIDTGVFYVMGAVNRPGVFSFNGREITVKQAVAVFGGFSQLAWPSRCEIVRREPGTDQQLTIPVNLDLIFAGYEDDILLRDDDILNVGTDIIAPFLYVIRNSFRFTYGFGFVYDRNFADKDAYGSKINPETLEIQRRQNQGLPF